MMLESLVLPKRHLNTIESFIKSEDPSKKLVISGGPGLGKESIKKIILNEIKANIEITRVPKTNTAFHLNLEDDVYDNEILGNQLFELLLKKHNYSFQDKKPDIALLKEKKISITPHHLDQITDRASKLATYYKKNFNYQILEMYLNKI